MTLDEFRQYWYPAFCEWLRYIDRFSTPLTNMQVSELHRKFAQFLGTDEYGNWVGSAVEREQPMSDNLKNLLAAIAGPHSRAILKTMEIRKGTKANEASAYTVQPASDG